MSFMGLKLLLALPVVALLLVLRLSKASLLAWSLTLWVGLFYFFKFCFVTPLPASVQTLYMAIVTISILAYVSSSTERWHACTDPIVRLIVEPSYRILLVTIVVALPLAAAYSVYAKMNVPLEAPQFGRTIHPAPPTEITVHEQEIDLVTADNPYRELEHSDPDKFAEHLQNGRSVYFQNCFYCHGDAMAGDGMFAHGLNPIPSNFTDPGVLPMLQESFLFWRVSKGAPGMPEEGGPWDSAMPAWENFLSEEEIWEVILFLYDYNDYQPRAQEVHE